MLSKNRVHEQMYETQTFPFFQLKEIHKILLVKDKIVLQT